MIIEGGGGCGSLVCLLLISGISRINSFQNTKTSAMVQWVRRQSGPGAPHYEVPTILPT